MACLGLPCRCVRPSRPPGGSQPGQTHLAHLSKGPMRKPPPSSTPKVSFQQTREVRACVRMRAFQQESEQDSTPRLFLKSPGPAPSGRQRLPAAMAGAAGGSGCRVPLRPRPGRVVVLAFTEAAGLHGGPRAGSWRWAPAVMRGCRGLGLGASVAPCYSRGTSKGHTEGISKS